MEGICKDMSSNGSSIWLYKAFLISKMSKHVAKGLSPCQHFQLPTSPGLWSFLLVLCPLLSVLLYSNFLILIAIPLFFSLPCPFSSTIQGATTKKAVSHSLSAISFLSVFLWTSLLPWIAEMGEIKEKLGINKIEKHKRFLIIEILQWLFSLRSKSAPV